MKEQRKKYLGSQIFHCLHHSKYEVKMDEAGVGSGNWLADSVAFSLPETNKDDFPPGKGLGINCSSSDALWLTDTTVARIDYILRA